MCGRYSISAGGEAISKRFNVDVPAGYQPRFNAAPTQLLPVITSENPDGISFFYWGLIPGLANNKAVSPKLYNTEAEILVERPALQRVMMKRRCLIPADGFYEWKTISKKSRVPYRLTIKDRNLFSFAGIWEEYEDEEERQVHTFTIVTTVSNDLVRSLNQRMPIILSDENEKSWLDESASIETLIHLLKPYPSEQMGIYSISSRLQSLDYDSPHLLEPAPPADQFGNYTLFG